MPARTFAAFLAIALAACSNYDFAKARKADGSYDMPKLIADLAASGKERLSEGLWIPLVHLDFTSFEPSKIHYPAGYTLTEMTAVGPLFAFADVDETFVDTEGATIERNELIALGLGILFYDYDESVVTPSGLREHERRRLLLLFGRDDVLYRRPMP